MSLAIAIVAFTLGAVLSLWLGYKFISAGWSHACHCATCKHVFIDMLERHQAEQHECYWRRLFRRSPPG